MYESIFGVESPKIVFDLGGPGEVTVILNHWVPLIDEPDERIVVQESELDSDREFLPRSEYLKFAGKVLLFKYGNLTLIRSKFEEIYQFKYKKVVLWKHRDGEPYKDADGNPILFFVKATPQNLSTLIYKDVLYLEFLSTKGVDYSDSSIVIPQANEIVMDGGTIVE